ncbi:MAG: MerR family transcriptional regulator [Sciscionella sp.]|nr:MerR family transcriptional regulator [Sciscionella sp.]
MRISEFARTAGTTARALRYYEQRGLLSTRRGANGHREYDATDLRLVRQIRSLLEIGFDLEDTRPFVDCLRAGNASGDVCPASIAVYRRKIAELDECIDRLRAIRDKLDAQLINVTEGKPCREHPCQQRKTRSSS